MKKKNVISIAVIVIIVVVLVLILKPNKKKEQVQEQHPEEILLTYFSLVEKQDYEEMYNMVNLTGDITKDFFLTRNKNIYEGIGASNIKITINSAEKNGNSILVTYSTNMSTLAGVVEFSNKAQISKNENDEYKINWSSNLIFPELNDNYKVRVTTTSATRGNLLDRNGKAIANQGTVYNVGIVSGKLGENRTENLQKISELLGLSTDYINNTLSSSWVKDDSFVPLKKISVDNVQLKQELLNIPGVMIDSETDRVYPYKEATSHITGYVQGINSEELEKLKDDGYNTNSIIGKTGLEKQYEERLRGVNGAKIYIEDDTGKNIKTIAELSAKNGENIKLTIDIDIQLQIYEQMKNDEGCFVVMNPQTGEILALVSTPSYDANKFVLGMNNDEWNEINNNEAHPLYARFLESWCPGSTFKPITAGIALTSGKVTEEQEFNHSGLSWQKDSSWKDHKVTTLKNYSGSKNLRNALIYSDNIYFAQLALAIGEETFTNGLDKLKFNEDINFELSTAKSRYSNTQNISSESILADSGYGQGEILVNPIHMASIYSAFANNGNMVKPYLEYKENKTVEYLVENAFSEEAANIIKEDLIQVVENPEGTGHDAKVNGITIAGKTGTAELKKPGEETGDILGWFSCFTVGENKRGPLLMVGMAENQGSSYAKKIVKSLLN